MPLVEEFEKQGNFLFKHRGFIPVFMLIAGFIFYLQHVDIHHYNFPYELICLLVSLFGFFIRIYTVGYSSKNTSGRNTEEQVADSLNTDGFYSIVRHPLYLANFFMWLGIAMYTLDDWFILIFLLLFWIYYERIMFAEEQYLRKKFDNEYLDWASRTPPFIPNFKRWKKPAASFDVSKVIRNEKTGLLALFATIFLFELLPNILIGKELSVGENFWLYGLLFALSTYCVIKILEKTNYLIN